MIRNIHHPSCPAARNAGGACICPGLGAAPRRRRDQLVETLAFAAMLGAVVSLPLYLLWRYAA